MPDVCECDEEHCHQGDGLKTSDLNEKPWTVIASTSSKNCRNIIREVVEHLDLVPNPEKPVIALSLGDPTVYGNLPPSNETVDAVIEALQASKFNGYAPASGFDAAKRAVAEYLTNEDVKPEPNDIYLCSGCSGALEMCITVLADASKQHNIIIPRPGFPLYRTLAETIGVEVRLYNLLPEKNFQIDIKDLRSQIDPNTAAIVVNNPSNPCGSVFSVEHLEDVLQVSRDYRVPIIADEIYDRIVFPPNKFVSLSALATDVPVLVCGGLAKRFLVPGWRIGWIFLHDPISAFGEIRKGLNCLSQRTMGSCTLIQGALPKILKNTPEEYHEKVLEVLERNSALAFRCLRNVKGLTAYMPQGTMYMMVEIGLDAFPMFKGGLEFVQRLMEEESVFCLPGEAFFLPGFMRLVLTLPGDLLKEACARIEEFCSRYYMLSPINNNI